MTYGILACTAYIPPHRIASAELASHLGPFDTRGIKTKAVPGFDEDALTMAIEAGRLLPDHPVTTAAVASTTLPYAEKAASGTLTTALGLPSDVFVTEHTTSTRAGTEAFVTAYRQGESARTGVMVLVADAPRSTPSSAFDLRAGAGAAAVLLGEGPAMATVDGWSTYQSEQLGVRFRVAGEPYTEDLGLNRLAESGFVDSVVGAVKPLLARLGLQPADFRFVVIQPVDGRLPFSAAARLGFTKEQLAPVGFVTQVGDTGAAAPLLGLAAALDQAQPGDRILVASFGSGSVSDAICLTAGPACGRAKSGLSHQMKQEKPVPMGVYLRQRGGLE